MVTNKAHTSFSNRLGLHRVIQRVQATIKRIEKNDNALLQKSRHRRDGFHNTRYPYSNMRSRLYSSNFITKKIFENITDLTIAKN